MAQIFLSYAREDEAQVRGIYRRLIDAGFEVWMDKIDLLPGQRWQQEIPRAIRRADFILIFFSRNSVAKRGYVQREFRLALDTLEEMPADTIHTIPIRLDDCEIPERFHHLQWSDLSGAGEFDRIVRALQLGMDQRQQFTPELALEPSPDPIPARNRTISESNEESIVQPSKEEPKATPGSLLEKQRAPDQQSRRVSIVTIVSLVIAAVGALAAVIVVPEVREWLGLGTTPEQRELSKAARGIEIGDSVLAEWRGDGCLYRGEVREIRGGRYHVYFVFDEGAWIAPKALVKQSTPSAAKLAPGTQVYAQVEDVRTRWIPSTVKDVRDGKYYLVFDENAQCRPPGKHHVWVGVDRIVMQD